MRVKILSTIVALFIGITVHSNETTTISDVQNILDNQLELPDGKYGEDSIGCITNLSLYREYFKQWKSSRYKSEAIHDAIVPWREVFLNCPRSSQNMYLDGLKIINYKLRKASDEEKPAYVDTIVMIYLQRIENFPTKKGKNQRGNLLGRLGVDLYQLAPERCSEAYGYLQESVELEQDNASVSSIVFYFRATIKKVKKGHADETLIVDTYDELMTLIEANIEKNADNAKKLAQWENAKGNVEKTFEPYATCDVLVSIYDKKFNETPDDLELLYKITKILKKKKCTSSLLFFGATEKLYSLEPTPKSAMLMGKMLLEKEKYKEAAGYMEEAVEMIDDDQEKAEILSDLGKIYYKLDQFQKARTYARKALSLNPNDGMSYVIMGDMYAASASECGDNDLTKKVAYWAAIDKYVQAKNADSELKELVNKRIAMYSKYYPSMETIFFHDLKVGDSYRVECWINETTKVRAAK
ncbi:MAG: tetratricopeptide repeat protein [Bacteroidales bacterium]|nr:tetratricopeptide repeat protein [Bacteroidales bacterium]